MFVHSRWAWFMGPQPSQVEVRPSKKHETTPENMLTAHAWLHETGSRSNRRQGPGKVTGKPAKMVRDGSPAHGGGGTVVLDVEVELDEDVVLGDELVVVVGTVVVDVVG